MSSIAAQQAVAEYHRELAQSGHHGGHDMFIFHRDWHFQNPDPPPPGSPEPEWGTDLAFGTNFLQMHHEMVKAADSEPKFHMMHQSLVSWYRTKDYDLPPPWSPLSPIPAGLAYEPDLGVFPDSVRQSLERRAASLGVTPEGLLKRKTRTPGFALPAWTTREGVGSAEAGEPYTGARKLADFRNSNQLGCCIVYPHNRWHNAVGGAMLSTATAIADPIFYFGVHWYIDRVFDEFKLIQAERNIRTFDLVALRAANAIASERIRVPKQFTAEQLAAREEDINISRSLTGLFEPATPTVTFTVAPLAGARGIAALRKAARPAKTVKLGPQASIPALMSVPDDDQGLDWLKLSLQRAIELELSTIPPYLCALWSIKSESGDVFDLIHEVVMDEMFHMGFACNLLTTIGGDPVLNTTAVVPTYPTEHGLPGGVLPDLVVSLEPLSKDVILKVFMEIEKPNWQPLALVRGMTFPTIGAFYEKIQEAFQRPDVVVTGQRQLTSWAPPVCDQDQEGCRQGHRDHPTARGRHPADGARLSDDDRSGPLLQIRRDLARQSVEAGVIGTGGDPYKGAAIAFPQDIYPMSKIPKVGYDTPKRTPSTCSTPISSIPCTTPGSREGRPARPCSGPPSPRCARSKVPPGS